MNRFDWILSYGFLAGIGWTFLRLLAIGREAAMDQAEADAQAKEIAEQQRRRLENRMQAESVKQTSDVELISAPDPV